MARVVRNAIVIGIGLALCFAASPRLAQAQVVTDVLLASEAAESWLHANGNWAGHRFSTLTQLNTGNVKNLKLAWIFSTGGKTDAQNTPLYHDGLVYFAQDNTVFAIDARTGRRVWRYEHKLPEDWGGYNVPFFTGKHRGLAIYGENIYFLSNDVKLHAINYKTGVAKFVKGWTEFQYPKEFTKAKDANGYFLTVGPLAIPGTIIVPMNATDTGGLPGYVIGVNPENGDIKWKANMIPGPGEPGYNSWPAGSHEFGGAGPWIVGAWDPELKMYKTGYIHYLDAKTGKFQKAVLFVDKINWIKGYDDNGRPIGQIALPVEGGPKVEVWPSLTGGVNMFPSAYNPTTGFVYLPAVNRGMKYFYEEIKQISNVRHFGANWDFIWGYEVNLAKDVTTGREVWRDQKSKDGYAGGMLTTAGNLTFYTSQNGAFQAVNATTGEILYTFNLGTTAFAGPITFSVDGKQCVVQPAGGTPTKFGYQEHNMEHGGLVAAFCL